jgi:hypothetical protein
MLSTASPFFRPEKVQIALINADYGFGCFHPRIEPWMFAAAPRKACAVFHFNNSRWRDSERWQWWQAIWPPMKPTKRIRWKSCRTF